MSKDLVPYDPATEVDQHKGSLPKLWFGRPRRRRIVGPALTVVARALAREARAQAGDIANVAAEVQTERRERHKAARSQPAGLAGIHIDNRGGEVHIHRRRRSNEAICWALCLACIVALMAFASMIIKGDEAIEIEPAIGIQDV